MERYLIGLIVVLMFAMLEAVGVAVRLRREKNKLAIELQCGKVAEVVRDFAAMFDRLPRDHEELRGFCGDNWVYRVLLQTLHEGNYPQDAGEGSRYIYGRTGHNRYVNRTLPDFTITEVNPKTRKIVQLDFQVRFLGPVDLAGEWWALYTQRRDRV